MSDILIIQKQSRTQPRRLCFLSEAGDNAAVLSSGICIFLTVFFLAFLYFGMFGRMFFLLCTLAGTVALCFARIAIRNLVCVLLLAIPLGLCWHIRGVSGLEKTQIVNPLGLNNLNFIDAVAERDSTVTSHGVVHHLILQNGQSREGASGTLRGNIRILSPHAVEPTFWGQRVRVFSPGKLEAFSFSGNVRLENAGWTNRAYKVRSEVNAWIHGKTDDLDQSGLLSAVLLGKVNSLAVVYKQMIRNCGASHLLAISGFHLGLLLSIVSLAAGKRKRRKYVRLFLLLSAWGYHFIVGPIASLTRASVTLTALFFFDNTRSMRILMRSMIAGTVILIFINPGLIGDPGFRLSFFALYGLLVFSPPVVCRLCRIMPRFLSVSFGSSLASQFATLGIVALSFGSIPVFSFIYILFLTPLFSLYAFSGIACLFFPAFSCIIIFQRIVISYILGLGSYNIVLSVSGLSPLCVMCITGGLWIYCLFRILRFHKVNEL